MVSLYLFSFCDKQFWIICFWQTINIMNMDSVILGILHTQLFTSCIISIISILFFSIVFDKGLKSHQASSIVFFIALWIFFFFHSSLSFIIQKYKNWCYKEAQTYISVLWIYRLLWFLACVWLESKSVHAMISSWSCW